MQQKCASEWPKPFVIILLSTLIYRAGKEKYPFFIFLHDQLPFFLGEIVEKFFR